MTLEEIRKKQAEIDQKILKLLEERVENSKKIGEIKNEEGISIENLDLEQEKLKKLMENSKISEEFLKEIWQQIFKESKRVQSKT